MFDYARTWLAIRFDKRGVTAMEYGLIAALVAVVIIASITAVGTNLRTCSPILQTAGATQAEGPAIRLACGDTGSTRISTRTHRLGSKLRLPVGPYPDVYPVRIGQPWREPYG